MNKEVEIGKLSHQELFRMGCAARVRDFVSPSGPSIGVSIVIIAVQKRNTYLINIWFCLFYEVFLKGTVHREWAD
jgi:hypothetical protein